MALLATTNDAAVFNNDDALAKKPPSMFVDAVTGQICAEAEVTMMEAEFETQIHCNVRELFQI